MIDAPFTVVVLADTPSKPCAVALKSPDGDLLGLSFDAIVSQAWPSGDVLATLTVEGTSYTLRNPRLCVRDNGQEIEYRL
jgi:hypothetical protein